MLACSHYYLISSPAMAPERERNPSATILISIPYHNYLLFRRRKKHIIYDYLREAILERWFQITPSNCGSNGNQYVLTIWSYFGSYSQLWIEPLWIDANSFIYVLPNNKHKHDESPQCVEVDNQKNTLISTFLGECTVP